MPSKQLPERQPTKSSPLALAITAALASVGLLAPESARAIDVEAAAQYTADYTSNTLRSETDEIGEWIHQPGADLRVSEDTATLEMDVDYSYIRRIYSKDIWQDENRLIGTAGIDWHALPDRLDFFLNNARTESSEQALQTVTQANRQVVSTTEAGSRLRFQPRAADEFQIEYLFRDIHTTITATDSQRHNGTLRYLLGLSENRALIATGTYSDIEYEGPFPNAEYAVVTIGYLQETGPVDLEINVGYNWFDREGRGTVDDPMYSGTLTWAATPTATFTLTGSRMITDQGSDLASGGTAGENHGRQCRFRGDHWQHQLDPGARRQHPHPERLLDPPGVRRRRSGGARPAVDQHLDRRPLRLPPQPDSNRHVHPVCGSVEPGVPGPG